MKKITLVIVCVFLFSCDNTIKQKDLHVKKWVVVGNSISEHPINEYWWGKYGMAASKRENDFAHVLNKMLNSSFVAVWGVDWERNHTTFDLSYFDSYFDGDEELIVFRLGENVTALENMESSYFKLINHIKKRSPDANIIVTGMFMGSTLNANKKDEIIKRVSERANLTHVPLLHLDTSKNRNKMGDEVMGDDGVIHTIDNEAVALHPNDIGMKSIAEEIYKGI